MRGSVQKKGSTYYAVIPLGNKRKWYKGGSTKKDAQRVLNEKLFELNSGTYKEIPKITFKKFGELWLENYVESNLKPSTINGYKDIVQKKLSFLDGKFLSEITTVQLQGYVASRLRTVSAKTVSNEAMVMKQLFKYARKWGYIKVNPADDVVRPKTQETEIQILNPVEVRRLVEKADSLYKIAFLTAFLTGLRAGELWALKWSDIDWNSNRLFVNRSIWKGNFQKPKTKKSIRKVDLTQQLMSELKKWRLACPLSDLDLIFPSVNGGTTNHINMMNRVFYPALKRAGLRQVSFHSLRHSNASIRIQGGQNIKYISEQLGHSSIRTTLDIYGHLFEDMNFTQQQVQLLECSVEAFENGRSSRNCLEAVDL